MNGNAASGGTRKRTVGLVTEWFDCGAGYVSKAFESALSTAGHDVFVLARGTRAPPADEFWNGANVTTTKRRGALTEVRTGDLRRWLRRHAIEIVIFNEQRHWQAVIDARREGAVVGAYVDYYRADSVPLFGLYDFLVCNTRRHHSVFAWHSNAHFVPWGVDCDVFAPRIRPERPVTFFHSAGWGGFHDRKGTGITLQAFSRVRGDSRLVVHSQKPVEAYPEPWRDLVRKDPRIEFINDTVRPPGLYHRGDVYVYPCRLDGIGLSVPEALACGLPAIVPGEAPWNEFVTDETGTLLPIRRYVGRQDGYFWPEVEVSVDDLAVALQRYTDKPDLCLAQGARARAWALDRIDWRTNGAQLATVVGSAGRIEVPTDLVERAKRNDLDTNPTVVQQWLRGNWRALTALAGR